MFCDGAVQNKMKLRRTANGLGLLLLFIFGTAMAQGDSTASSVLCVTSHENNEAAWEAYLSANPEDTQVAACILDYYAQRLSVTKLQSRRMRLIRWVAENHPDIQLQRHLAYDLRISANVASYPEIRELWLAQVDRFPDSPVVLSNAAASLALTDGELAVAWLKRTWKLQPDNDQVVRALSEIYARAIIGLTKPDAELVPTAIDPALARSPFARSAWREASQDPALATMTGLALHSWANNLRYRKITDFDFDPLAEQLLEKAEDLQYPKATLISALKDFYRDQESKRGDSTQHLTPGTKIADLSPDEVLQRVDVSRSAYSAASGGLVCDIIVGTDGHVWTTAVEGVAADAGAHAILGSAGDLVFLPLRVDGEPERFRAKVVVQSSEQCREP
jgi:hypothetical protein